MWSKGIWVLGVIIVLAGCKSKQALVVDMEKKNSKEISACMIESHFQPEWFSAKIGTTLFQKGEKTSFKTSLRIRKDSLIWAQIMKGPAVGAIATITPDSVKVVIKIGQKQLIVGSFDDLRRRFGLDLDFYMLQDLLIGNPVSFDQEVKYKDIKDTAYYVLSTHSPRQIEKAFEKLPKKEEKQYIQRFWVRPEDCKTARVEINSLRDTSNISIEVEDYKTVDDYLVPKEMVLIGDTPGDTIRLELDYSKYKINKSLSFPFKVNPTYPVVPLIQP